MGKPDAYLVAGGKLFSDVAVRTLDSAELRRGQRNDDSIIVPLYAIDDETRDAISAGINALNNAGGVTMSCAEADKHIATLERLRGE